jgi:hypothetical protein
VRKYLGGVAYYIAAAIEGISIGEALVDLYADADPGVEGMISRICARSVRLNADGRELPLGESAPAGHGPT